MSQVATVRGPADSRELGRTYVHEHIFTLTADVQQNHPGEWGSEEARIADAVEKLRALAAQGIRAIVDPTVVGLGRYIPRIQRVAEQVPELNIVVATGIYTYDSVPFFFHRERGVTDQQIDTMLVASPRRLFEGGRRDPVTPSPRAANPAPQVQ